MVHERTPINADVCVFQDRNLDWFPRLRAMSLAADESEGEQIELRTLQTQLEKTQVLVTTLTQQLLELKEQVLANEMILRVLRIG